MNRLIWSLFLLAILWTITSQDVWAQSDTGDTARNWQTVLSEMPRDGRVPELGRISNPGECVASYVFPDSVALITEDLSKGGRPATLFTWVGRTSMMWRPMAGPTQVDTLRVAVVGPGCSYQLRTGGRMPVLGDMTQLLVEKNGAVFSLLASAIRTPNAPLDDHREVFVIGASGHVVESVLDRDANEHIELRPFDRVAAERRARAVQDSERARADSVQSRQDALREERRVRAGEEAAEREAQRVQQRREREEERLRLAAEREAQWLRDEAKRRDGIETLGRERGWEQAIIRAVVAREVLIGMGPDMVRRAWGPPGDVNRTITRDSTTEQWVYGPGRYVYFEDGKVSMIQTQQDLNLGSERRARSPVQKQRSRSRQVIGGAEGRCASMCVSSRPRKS
jgi:hypothetical protein